MGDENIDIMICTLVNQNEKQSVESIANSQYHRCCMQSDGEFYTRCNDATLLVLKAILTC